MHNDDETRTEIPVDDLIALINRCHAHAIANFREPVIKELAYILGRCTAHAEHIRPIQQRGD